MSRLYYDFHIHSCLSPCADNDMTPAAIAGMAAVCGLSAAALTDHNSTKNCPAFFEACRYYGVVPIAGAELTTAEDIHLLCLFPSLEAASEFDFELQRHRILIPNRADVFGDQLILDAEDMLIGQEPDLLINATDLSLDDAFRFAVSFGAAALPAHVDRESNGVIAVLGDFPAEPAFAAAEFACSCNREEYLKKYPLLAGLASVTDSDAHRLLGISEAVNSLPIEQGSEGEVTSAVLRYLGAK